MMPMSIGRGTGEARNDYIGTQAPYCTNVISQDRIAVPLLRSLLSTFGKTEVVRLREVLGRSIAISGPKQLFGSEYSQCFVLLGSEEVLAAVAASRGKICRSQMEVSSQIRKQGIVLVVGMRPGQKHGPHDRQPLNGFRHGNRISCRRCGHFHGLKTLERDSKSERDNGKHADEPTVIQLQESF